MHVTVPQILLNGPNPLRCRMKCAGISFSAMCRPQYPAENLSAAMALVSLDSPIRVTSGKSQSEHVFSASPPEDDIGPMDHLSVVVAPVGRFIWRPILFCLSEPEKTAQFWCCNVSVLPAYFLPMATEPDYYIATFDTGGRPHPWRWELKRHSSPMGVIVGRSGYQSQTAAEYAGKRALEEFLTALAREERYGQ